jgi:hypothetical protein
MFDDAHFARHCVLGYLDEQYCEGALVARDPSYFETMDILGETEKETLRKESTHN